MTDTVNYTAEEVAAGFGGAVSFSPQAAAATATAINQAGDLGSMNPDDAGKAVQLALYKATGNDKDEGGVRVSIDTCLQALTAIHVRKGLAGASVGFTDQPGAARGASSDGADGGNAPQGSGTAAAGGGASQGGGAGAGTEASRNGTGPKSGAKSKSSKRSR